MVDLVLDHSRLEPLGLDPHRFAGRRARLHRDGYGSLDGYRDTSGVERQTSFVDDVDLLRSGNDPGVDERGRLAVLVGLSRRYRWRIPIWGAARPTPWAEAITPVIRSTSAAAPHRSP